MRYCLTLFAWLTLFTEQVCAADFVLEDAALTECVTKLAKKRAWQSPDQVTEIKCHNRGVTSAKGLAEFTQLEKLSLYKNKLSEIDLSALTRLQHLNLAGNQIRSFIIQDCPQLEVLYLFHNALKELTITGCSKLTQVKANNNQLIQVELAGLAGLKKLYLFDNQLEIIDIAQSGALRYLDVRHNPMPDDFYDYLDSLPGLTSLHDGNAEDWN